MTLEDDEIFLDQAMFSSEHVFAAYTPYGIRQLDTEFAKRIIEGENTDKLRNEILTNPHLHKTLKDNLIDNLNNRNL